MGGVEGMSRGERRSMVREVWVMIGRMGLVCWVMGEERLGWWWRMGGVIVLWVWVSWGVRELWWWVNGGLRMWGVVWWWGLDLWCKWLGRVKRVLIDGWVEWDVWGGVRVGNGDGGFGGGEEVKRGSLEGVSEVVRGFEVGG